MCLLILLRCLEHRLTSNVVIWFRRVSHWRCVYRRTDRKRLLHIVHILRESRYKLLTVHELMVHLFLLEVHVLITGCIEPRLVSLILLIYIRLDELNAGRGCHLSHMHLSMVVIALILFGIVSTLILFRHLSAVILVNGHRVIAAQATSHLVVDAKLWMGGWFVVNRKGLRMWET